MSIDGSTHSLFGVSKAAADLLVQEYGRYFDMPTVCFRGGCLTGPNHAGTQLHGFLSYLMRCTITGQPYTVFGYGGKQVRDNIHSADLVAAFEAFRRRRRAPAPVYNLGGGRACNCSMLEAIAHVRGDRRARARLDVLARRTASATTAGGSPTCSAFERDYPELVAALLGRGHPAPDPRRERGALGAGVNAVGRHPGPQRGGGDRADAAGPDRRSSDPRGSTTRSSSSTTRRATGPATSCAGWRRRSRACASCATRRPTASASRSARGSRRSRGDAVAIVMADGSDDPRDVVLYYRVLEAGYDCAFGSRFMPGAQRARLPEVQAADEPGRQPRHPRAVPPRVQRHDQRVQGLPARGDREPAPAALPPLQHDRRAAAEGDHARVLLRDRADLVDQPRGGHLEAPAQRDGQPLPVHRALRVPRGPPEPRRLPPPAGAIAPPRAGR